MFGFGTLSSRARYWKIAGFGLIASAGSEVTTVSKCRPLRARHSVRKASSAFESRANRKYGPSASIAGCGSGDGEAPGRAGLNGRAAAQASRGGRIRLEGYAHGAAR